MNLPTSPPYLSSLPPSPPHHDFVDISELAHQIPKRSLSFYLVLCFSIIPLWSLVPVSWAFLLYVAWSGILWGATTPWHWSFLTFLALCEALFSIYHFFMSRRIAGPSPIGPNDLSELQTAYSRVLAAGLGLSPDIDLRQISHAALNQLIYPLDPLDPRAVDFRNFLRTWFGRVPWSSIRRGNIYTWLYWSIFNASFTSIEDVPKSHRTLLEETVALLEKRSGANFPDGHNPDVISLRLTLDPVATAARPFLWYVLIALANTIVRWRLESKWHARRGVFKGLDYILRVPPNWSPSSGARPVVFIHGLGVGILQYAHFLDTILKAEPDRPFLIPLLPHVSQDIFHPRYLRPIGRHEFTRCLSGLLKDLGWVDRGQDLVPEAAKEAQKTATGVTMLSHSNGTFAHCWFLKAHPEMVTRSCLVDPVVFCQWEGDLCYNFVYRSCTTGLELIIKYFVGMELGVAYYIQRHFCWSSNTLWFDEIPDGRDPSKAMFILGGKDDIINGPRVQQYLQYNGIERGLYYDPNGRHGQALLTNSNAFSEIMKWLREPTNPAAVI